MISKPSDNYTGGFTPEVYLGKYSADGSFVFVRWIHSPGDDYDLYVEAIAVDSKGDVYLTGEAWGGSVNGDGFFSHYGYYIAKVSKHGKFIWAQPGFKYGGSSRGRGLAIDSADNVYTIGRWRKAISLHNKSNDYYYSGSGVGLLNKGNFSYLGFKS